MVQNSLFYQFSHILIFGAALLLFGSSYNAATISCNSKGECIEHNSFILDEPRKFYIQQDLNSQGEIVINHSQYPLIKDKPLNFKADQSYKVNEINNSLQLSSIKSKNLYQQKDSGYYAVCETVRIGGVWREVLGYNLRILIPNGCYYKFDTYLIKSDCMKNADILNTELLNAELPKNIKLPSDNKLWIEICLIMLTLILLEMYGMPAWWYKWKINWNLKWHKFKSKYFK